MSKNSQFFLSALTSLCLLFAATTGACAQQPGMPPDGQAFQTDVAGAVDQLVMKDMAEQNIPGYALAVIKDGNLIVCRGYGLANLETRQPVTPDTVFGLASMTKTFTALVLLTLLDQNQIRLDDTLDQFIGDLPPYYCKLTLRQLASMTAGVPSEVTREVDWRNQLGILTAMPLVSQPGSQFLYSNFSYRLLGSVIERVSGKPYFEAVKERVFGPLGMNMSGTTVTLAPSGMVAQGYGDNMGKSPVHPVQYKNPEVSFAAGMLATTLNDMIKYTRALLARQILSPPSYQILWYQRPPLTTGAPCPWAFGWNSQLNKKYGDARVVAMNGGTNGVASTVIMLPDKNSAVIALCNLRKPQSYAISKKVAALVFGVEAPPSPSQTNEEAEPAI